jgi:hypothetical protein
LFFPPTILPPLCQGTAYKGALYNRSDCVESFLHGLIDQLCEVQSDNGELHLPFGHRKDVFERYREETASGNERCPAVARTLFYKVWSQRLPHLKVRAFHRFDTESLITAET